MWVSLLASLLFCPIILAGRILIWSPSISHSHIISNGRIADALVKDGHEVVMFIPMYKASTRGFNGTKLATVYHMENICDIRFRNYLKKVLADVFDSVNDEFVDVLNDRALSAWERIQFEFVLTHLCEKLMERRAEFEFLRAINFDVAFSEQIDLCGAGVIHYLGIQNHIWISTTSIMDAVSYNLGVPHPTSYVPAIEENDLSDRMSFWGRVQNLYMHAVSILIHRIGTDGTTKVFREIAGPDFPNVRDIARNSSLCFVNSDEFLDFPRPILHQTIYIGGLGIGEGAPLSKEWEERLSKGQKGVILFSLGTIAPLAFMSEDKKMALFTAFENLKEFHFIVKIEKGDDELRARAKHLKNVELVTWVPQKDVLRHPRVLAFFMHGGLNGLLEAAWNAVPVIVTPIFADQYRNGRAVEKRGIGRVLLKTELTSKRIEDAIKEVALQPRYKRRAERISRLMHKKPLTAEERLVQWTRLAVEEGVLEEIRVEGASLTFLVYHSLDIIAVFLTILLIVLHLARRIIRLCFSTMMKTKKE